MTKEEIISEIEMHKVQISVCKAQPNIENLAKHMHSQMEILRLEKLLKEIEDGRV